MSSFTGTVVSVALETDATKQAGGTYKAWQLVYKGSDGKIKDVTKPVQGLKYNAQLKEALAALAPGDVFTMTVEKNDKGFNDVKSLVKGADAAAMPTAPSNVSSGGTRVTGSNYETKEERAARQRLIVRQSSLTAALSYNELVKGKPSIEEVIELADYFTNWVFEVKDEEPK